MKYSLADFTDRDKLSHVLTQVFLLVEHLNKSCLTQVRKEPAKRKSVKEILLSIRRSLATQSSRTWPIESTLASVLDQVGMLPFVDSDIVDFGAEVILKPQKVNKDADWSTKGERDRAQTELPSRLTLNKLFILESDDGAIDFCTADPHPFAIDPRVNRRITQLSDVRVYSWDQALDPISVMQKFLFEYISSDDIEQVNHYIQTWLRHFFKLRYRGALKYSLKAIANFFNEGFYGNRSPSIAWIRNKRSEIVDAEFLIRQIQSIMIGALLADENKENKLPDKETERLSLLNAAGIHVFLRFCRLLRIRYLWIDSKDPEPGVNDSVKRHIESAQGCSALRPLEYTYFQARVFGAIVAIPGLNFIFRGAIIPRTETGRAFVVEGPPGSGKTVFALQRLAGIAARGGLAVYFSFEEGRELIMDRLVTFNFLEPDLFDVCEGGEKCLEQIASRRGEEQDEGDSHRGLFVLYGEDRGAPFSLNEAIAKVATATGGKWRWKSVAIDSINALDFRNENLDGEGSSVERVGLRDLIHTIEDHGFLGIVISEEDSLDYVSTEPARFPTLPYLADTLIRLTVDRETPARSVEILKCRSQNYHQGKHRFHISEGQGIKIYPSMPAILSTLRRRMKSTISEHRVISPPDNTLDPEFAGIREKSCTVVFGPQSTGKTVFLLNLAATPAQTIHDQSAQSVEPSVLVITFRTSESKFLQLLSKNGEVYSKWQKLASRRVRWYSPGLNIGAEEVIDGIWRTIDAGRQQGLPIDRIVVDEVESASVGLPQLGRDPSFWTTLLELLGTEAITSFFGVTASPNDELAVCEILRSNADYVFSRENTDERWQTNKEPPLARGS